MLVLQQQPDNSTLNASAPVNRELRTVICVKEDTEPSRQKAGIIMNRIYWTAIERGYAVDKIWRPNRRSVLSLSFNENVNSNRADNKTSRWLAAADADAVLNWSQTGQTRFSVPEQPQKLGKLNSGFLPLYTTAAKSICKSLNRTQRERKWVNRSELKAVRVGGSWSAFLSTTTTKPLPTNSVKQILFFSSLSSVWVQTDEFLSARSLNDQTVEFSSGGQSWLLFCIAQLILYWAHTLFWRNKKSRIYLELVLLYYWFIESRKGESEREWDAGSNA